MTAWWTALIILGWWKGKLYPHNEEDLGSLVESLGKLPQMLYREMSSKYE